jgi:predicted kinase
VTRLVVVCGLPGVGKSTVSAAFADRLDATRLRTDVVRRDLAEDPGYSDAERERVYAELFARAADRFAAGERAVVLDGTFVRRADRDRAVAVARGAGAGSTFVHVDCAVDVVRERMAVREDDASDADFAVHREYRESGAFDPLERDHVTVDNSGSLAATRRQVAAALDRLDARGAADDVDPDAGPEPDIDA